MKQISLRAPLKSVMFLAGFTLIEVLLVVSVIAMLSVLSIPRFSQAYQNILLKKQTEDIVYLMRYAQSRAINKNRPLQFLFNEEFSSYRLLEADTEDYQDIKNTTFISFHNRLARVRKISPKTQIKSDINKVYFYPDGRISKASFEVCSRRKCFAVSTEIQRGNVNFLGPIQNEQEL